MSFDISKQKSARKIVAGENEEQETPNAQLKWMIGSKRALINIMAVHVFFHRSFFLSLSLSI